MIESELLIIRIWTYEIKDSNREKANGKFYEKELLRCVL